VKFLLGRNLENRSEKLHPPESLAADCGIALLCFALSCLYLRLFYDYSILNADEGIVLQGAQRILQGQVLYRDFFSFFTPGSYYWMALLFKIFGSSILVARGALMVYGGIFSALAYLLARRVAAPWSALFACYALTLTCLPYRFLALHNWDSTVLACLTLYCAVRWLEAGNWQPATGNWFWALATGSIASLTFLFEHSKGAGLLLGLGVGLLALGRLSRQPNVESPNSGAGNRKLETRNSKLGDRAPQSPTPNPQPRRPAYCLLPSAYWFVGGLAWPFVMTFAYFAAHQALIPMFTDWVWPVFHYSQANRLPYGYLVMSTPDRGALFSGSWPGNLLLLLTLGPCMLLPVLPLVALGVFLWFVLKRPQGGSEFGPRTSDRYFVLVSAVLCGLLSSTFLTKRPDFTHLNYIAPLFCLVYAWVFDGANLPSRSWNAVKPLVVFFVFLSYTAFGMSQLLQPLGAHHRLMTPRGTLRTGSAEVAMHYFQAQVAPGERTFIYPYQPLYYYLTGTFSATRFDYFQPGLHTSDQLRDAIGELEASPPRVVLLDTSFSEKVAIYWPETPLPAIAAKEPIADYLFEHYRPCRALGGFWHFVLMVRKGDRCPDG